MPAQQTKIITTTGTKGKTSVTRTIAAVLNTVLPEPVLSVDTSRVRLGERTIISHDEVMALSGLRSSIAPGRFLYALQGSAQPVAVLEASIGSSMYGTGYHRHQIGVFTNVYDDHIGEKPYLRSRQDIAEAKSFVFSRIARGGCAVFNAADNLVCGQLGKVPQGATRIACAVRRDAVVADSYDYLVTAESGELRILEGDAIRFSLPVASVVWLHGGNHEPSLWNALSILGALFFFFGNRIPDEARQAFCAYEPEDTGGRMVVKQAAAGYTVILDYAHEGESLRQIGQFARSLAAPGGQVAGIVRLSGERPDEHILRTARVFAPCYDRLIIREKSQGAADPSYRFYRKPGAVAALIAREADRAGVQYEIVEDEAAAMRLAAGSARPGDVVVSIIDNAANSLMLAKEAFRL